MDSYGVIYHILTQRKYTLDGKLRLHFSTDNDICYVPSCL